MIYGFQSGWYARAKQAYCCEICLLPIFLDPGNCIAICSDCEETLERERELCEKPCPTCERRHLQQFSCDWCGDRVCDGCVNMEHDDNYECRCPGDSE